MLRKDISIIVPVYNGERYLSNLMKAVYDLHTQATKKRIGIELILINDGSLDNSGIECKKLEDKYEFVFLYEKQNSGIADTRNFGLQHAQGEYVLFIDQDDIFVPDVCLHAFKKLKETGADCCLWSSNHIFPDGRQTMNVRIPKESIYIQHEIRQALLEQYLQKEENERIFHIPGYVWSGLYTLNFLKTNNIRFFSFVYCEDDCIFVNQVMRYAERIVMIPDVGYLWSCNPKSESHRSRYIQNYWEKTQKLNQWFSENIYDIFDDYKPPKEKLDKEMALNLYAYIENECSLQNPSSSVEISQSLKNFFENEKYYKCIRYENKPYGGAGMRRQILHALILRRKYRIMCLFLRMHERTIQKLKIRKQ